LRCCVNGTSEATGEHKVDFKALMRVTMTDSIKHFTGFDISGKMKPVFEAGKRYGN
jgi:lysyl-tRNA synthetase class 2